MKRKFRKKAIVQSHHISYDPEWTTRMYAEEHFYVSRIENFRSPVSRGFLIALQAFILKHQPSSINLDKKYDKQLQKELDILKEKIK